MSSGRKLQCSYNCDIRYWFFALFVVSLTQYNGNNCEFVRTRQPVLQMGRSALLFAHICVAVRSFILDGLVEYQATLTSHP